jgi:hypothetical protein
MKIDVQNNCPLNAFEKCKTTNCAWFIQVRGMNKNTGEDVDEWGCAIAWLPVLLIENASQSKQTGAAVESFRNEMVKTNDVGQQILLASINASQQNQILHKG